MLRAATITVIVFCLPACATAHDAERMLVPSAEEIQTIRQVGWQNYIEVYSDPRIPSDQPRIPTDSTLDSISNVSCERDQETEAKTGWVRFLTCKFDINYTSPTQGSGKKSSVDFFALSKENGWTNRVLSSK